MKEQSLCWFSKNQLFPLCPLLIEAETDDEVALARKDLLLAFVLEMNGIERLRYLSQTLNFPVYCKRQAVEIIERCALHSEELATTIFNVSRFLKDPLQNS